MSVQTAKAPQPPVWDLGEMYEGPDDPRIAEDMAEAERRARVFAEKWSGRTDYLTDPVALAEALREIEENDRYYGTGDKPLYFVAISRIIDLTDERLKAMEKALEEQETRIGNLLTFFILNLGKITPEDQPRMLAAPELAPFRHFLEHRFNTARYDLSEETTNALAFIIPQATSDWADMVEKKISERSAWVWDGERKVRKPFNALMSMMHTSDPEVAESVGQGANRILAEVAPMAEHELNAILKTRMLLSRLHGYSRPDEQRFIADHLEAPEVDAMLAAIEDRFPAVHRYYALKARMLGVDSFSYWQRNLDFEQVPAGYTFEDACNLVRRVVEQLDPRFAEMFDEALASGHIDAAPRKGKSGGACCVSGLISMGSYIMLNFMGSFGDVHTLGHEFGHHLNNLHMQESCNALTYHVPTPLAEVASIFIEQFVDDELLGGVEDEEVRLVLLMAKLEDEIASVFRQAAAMRTEQEFYREIDEQGYLSCKQISEIFTKNMATYLGDAVTMDPGSELWWVYWSHLRNGFYNYSYCFGNLVANALHARVVDDPGYMDEVRRFLSSGKQRSPRELLDSMGLDITDVEFWKSGIADWEQRLGEAEELAVRLGY